MEGADTAVSGCDWNRGGEVMNFMACWRAAMSSSRRAVLDVRMGTGHSWLRIVSSGGFWY